MKKAAIILTVLAAAAAAYVWRADLLTPKGKIIKRSRFTMDTICTIQVPNELGASRTKAAIDKALDRMAEIGVKFNCTSPDSPIYQFNNNRTPIRDPELVAVIKEALEISRTTGGAYDPTMEPLEDLWGFYTTSKSSGTVPSPAAVKAALDKTGWRRIIVRDGEVTAADKDVSIDLGGIAKGYAIGEAEKVLKAEGVTSALILGGGQVQVFGHPAPGKDWKVGVRNPRHEGYMAGLVFPDENGISTSGDYERYFIVNGVRYHHIMDPANGYPARGTMSVSVMLPDPTKADALSTALFVMGPRKAMEFLRKYPAIGYIIVDSKGKIYSSRDISGN